MMRKIVVFTLLVVLVFGLGLAVWINRFSGPSIAISEENGVIMLSNAFLGEYYLGFTEVEIKDQSSGVTLIHAIQGKGAALDRVILDPNSGIADDFLEAGWTITCRVSNRSVIPGTSYKLVLRGNNGFGYNNKTTKVVKVPQLSSQQMPKRIAAADGPLCGKWLIPGVSRMPDHAAASFLT